MYYVNLKTENSVINVAWSKVVYFTEIETGKTSLCIGPICADIKATAHEVNKIFDTYFMFISGWYSTERESAVAGKAAQVFFINPNCVIAYGPDGENHSKILFDNNFSLILNLNVRAFQDDLSHWTRINQERRKNKYAKGQNQNAQAPGKNTW